MTTPRTYLVPKTILTYCPLGNHIDVGFRAVSGNRTPLLSDPIVRPIMSSDNQGYTVFINQGDLKLMFSIFTFPMYVFQIKLVWPINCVSIKFVNEKLVYLLIDCIGHQNQLSGINLQDQPVHGYCSKYTYFYKFHSIF